MKEKLEREKKESLHEWVQRLTQHIGETYKIDNAEQKEIQDILSRVSIESYIRGVNAGMRNQKE